MRKMRFEAALGVMLAVVAGVFMARATYGYDSGRAYPEAGNALVAPFDVNDGKVTFVAVSNVGDQKLSTHWAFWSSSCEHLVNVSVCLTPDDTVVVDPRALQAVDENNDGVGPTIDLSGNSGFFTVTAFATDETCQDRARTGAPLVDDTLIGTVTLADLATTASLGATPLTLGLDPTGSRTELPDLAVIEVNAETFAPEDLEASTLYAFALEENAGDFPGELGPIAGSLIASASYYDNMEIRTSLPDLDLGCAAALDLLSFLKPLGGATAGTLRLEDLMVLRNDGTSAEPLGGSTGAFGYVFQALGPFGVVSTPHYKLTSIFD